MPAIARMARCYQTHTLPALVGRITRQRYLPSKVGRRITRSGQCALQTDAPLTQQVRPTGAPTRSLGVLT